MDYIKLANLLFKDYDLTIKECFEAYPKRILPKDAEVVRIAPSPTGYLHIGSVYGAFIDKLIAYHSNGIFYMRLEDTDSKREVENAGDKAYDMLSVFGLKPDEGYIGTSKKEVGSYGPYIQSERKKIYIAFAKYLVSIGRAYPCFCRSAQSKEEIEKRREESLSSTHDIEERDKCRDLSFEEIERNVLEGKPFAIRLRSMGDENKTFSFKDEIKGKREIRENTKDIVILKSDFTPPYSLAHVVDDTLMGTTLVVRGEEWYPSLASHLELFSALNLTPPKYAHTPVVCKMDEDGNKRKLSKRKDKEADARYFIEQGYPVSSVMEYLLNLINSDFEDWRRANKEKSFYEFPFKVSKIGSNNPMFDFQKLNDFSKEVISQFSGEEIYNRVLSWALNYDKGFYEILVNKKDFAINLFNIDRTGKNVRKDIAKWSDVSSLYDYMFFSLDNKKLEDYEFDSKFEKQDIISILKEYKELYSDNDDKDEWFRKIRDLCPKYNFCSNMKEYRLSPESYKGSVADMSSIIRVAITTRKNTPDLYFISSLLGKKEIAKRLDKVIKLLKEREE